MLQNMFRVLNVCFDLAKASWPVSNTPCSQDTEIEIGGLRCDMVSNDEPDINSSYKISFLNKNLFINLFLLFHDRGMQVTSRL